MSANVISRSFAHSARHRSSYCWFCSFCSSPISFISEQGGCYTAETPAKSTGQEVMRTRVQRLSTQVVIMMVTILVVTLAAGFAVVQHNLNSQLDEQYEHRALAVAQTLAAEPSLQRAVRAGDPGGVSARGVVQAMAMAAAGRTGAAFVVVTNGAGNRLSHPKPHLIGLPVWSNDHEPASSEPFRTGRLWMGVQHGTLGMEAVGKAPLVSQGRLIGEVSVGFLTATVAGEVASTLAGLASYFLAVPALGVLAAFGLSRRLKR